MISITNVGREAVVVQAVGIESGPESKSTPLWPLNRRIEPKDSVIERIPIEDLFVYPFKPDTKRLFVLDSTGKGWYLAHDQLAQLMLEAAAAKTEQS